MIFVPYRIPYYLMLISYSLILSFPGEFEYQFTEEGMYYYWSGFVDASEELSFRGSIKVLPKSDLTKPMTLKMKDIEATYETSGNSYFGLSMF